MPIRVSLDRVLLERRMSLTELADRVGVTIANLSILKTGKACAVRFSSTSVRLRLLKLKSGTITPARFSSMDSARSACLSRRVRWDA